MLQRLVEILEEKSTAVSQDQHLEGGRFKAGLSARHIAQFWFLHAVNSSLSPLRHLLLTKHGHPEELFREMLRLGGALCTFSLDTHPSTLPAYDHKNLDRCFHQLDDHIRRLLEIVVPSQAIVIPLKQGNRYFYEGLVNDPRCFDRSRWLLGIHAAIGEADLITRTLQLVKVCSAKFVPELVKRAVPGFTLTHVPIPPSAIAAKVEYQYFSINRSGPCWEHLMQTKSAGVYVPGRAAVSGTGVDRNSRLLRHFMSTQVSPLSSYRGSSTALDRRGWNLALCFQEIFTATVRLKYRQQNVPSADSFRAQMKQALHAAEQDALARGYKIDDIRRVIFAVVAFLDESVLSCRHPAFADWPRLPLQAELYGNQLAGETFFKNCRKSSHEETLLR